MAVAVLRGRSPAVLAFAAYALGSGSLNVAYAFYPLPQGPGLLRVALVFGMLGYWGLFLFFPRRLTRADVVSAVAAATVALAMGLGYAVYADYGTADRIISGLVSGGIIAVALILPIRAGSMNATRTEARSLGIVAVGLVAASSGTFSHLAQVARGESPAMVGLLNALYVLIPTLLWLSVTRGPHSRLARTVIVASATIYLTSLATGPNVAWAVGQVLAALLLGYAVLRGQIEGLDVKVRWGISRSTVAAAFVTVFFLASEGAQIFFGSDDPWVGLAAAGALVFAIAPLQRAAERLAEKAVPLPPEVPAPATAGPDRHAAYRLAIQAALRDDGRLTTREETHLADLAQTLGVGAGDALRLRREVEANAATAGGDGL